MKVDIGKGTLLLIGITVIVVTFLMFHKKGSTVLVKDMSQFSSEPSISLTVCKSDTVPLQDEMSRIRNVDRRLTPTEEAEVAECRKRNLKQEHKKSWDTFFSNKIEFIRWKNHTYLNGDSTVIEVGGNVGLFTENLNKLFHPRRYIVLEPMETFYNGLVNKFRNMPNIIVLKFGLASRDRVDMVRVDGGSTSRFLANKGRTAPLRQVNATNFFATMAVGYYEVDLLTMNCEGCEYDILDAVLSTNLVHSFRHIQISFHHLDGLGDTLKRWCEYQQLLKRTHRLVYQYDLFWESWTRKDLKM